MLLVLKEQAAVTDAIVQYHFLSYNIKQDPLALARQGVKYSSRLCDNLGWENVKHTSLFQFYSSEWVFTRKVQIEAFGKKGW